MGNAGLGIVARACASGAATATRQHRMGTSGSYSRLILLHIEEAMQGRAVVRELSLACLSPTLPAHRQSERRCIDRPSHWSPTVTQQLPAAHLNKPCCRCPGFCRQVHAQHHQHGAHGAMAAHKALSHAPRTQTRSRTRLHMQHMGGLMRELIAVGIREFCGQWATYAFVTPWASTEPRARIRGARDGPSGRPFGQSAWP